jgi:hypothetical protein
MRSPRSRSSPAASSSLLAITRLPARINAIYAADLIGAAAGCLILIPLLDRLGAPGVVLVAAALSVAAAILFAPAIGRRHIALAGLVILLLPFAGQLSGRAVFDVVDTKGHQGDRVLFSKWNSFSRIGVYERTHGDWSLSWAFKGTLPETRFMDIDSAASTPILHLAPDLSNAQYLRYELTALAYHLKEQGPGTRGVGLAETSAQTAPGPQPPAPAGFTALVIGPGGGRDLASALVFGASRVDGVEINPIIANDVMRDRFRAFSGGIYTNPRVRIAVDDGRSFVRPDAGAFDVIQASLVDTWAATAAGAYTLTENSLYYRRGLRRLPRSPDRRRSAHDHALGSGRAAPRVARAGGVRAARLAGPGPSGHRAARKRRDLPAEEDAVHLRRDRAAARGFQAPGVRCPVRARRRRWRIDC